MLLQLPPGAVRARAWPEECVRVEAGRRNLEMRGHPEFGASLACALIAAHQITAIRHCV